MASPKILVFAGSLRVDSFNKKLAHVAKDVAEAAGAKVTYLDLRDYRIPPYDGDMEAAAGIPERAQSLRELMAEQDGFIIASPEYNGSIPGTLKNYIDWVSRPDGDVPGLVAFKGKVAALLSASPGALGGMRGLVHLRAILGGIGVLVTPEQHAVGKAHEAFDEAGQLKDGKQQTAVEKVVQRMVEVTGRLGQAE
ncbi:MAG: NAD(P)H-dependent oxidoreductase [Salinisphaeraceae bacterium]|nr:NAD(P)H-dependent oxidoreductase [Salinisphaeraceae bacterium]